ncbi:sigma-S stabilization anti-adapter protein IraP [Leclercia adecarboxylata]|uniref:sigma-S stabilization anti-adapter protein IraP n=1 Tax=Leclercia adecarboxylata TaxID=83655 RepID=UPI0021F1405E|nr:sigma-S stabilization anti-adapter protein IraP [Leclercia adecarboxylata]UYM58244.1 hypothetical protein N5937_24865 [Leclercia adecarboxylata]
MRALLAELVNIIAEQHETEKVVIIQTEALNLIVAALLMRLDDSVRVQLKRGIDEAFASQHGGHPSYTDEKHMLLCAVEKLFNFYMGPSPEKIRIRSGKQP